MVTSPPYWGLQRSYQGDPGMIRQAESLTFDEHLDESCGRVPGSSGRVLRKDWHSGWINYVGVRIP